MENNAPETAIITTEAAQYPLCSGETILMALKVKRFGDDGSDDILIEAVSGENFISSIVQILMAPFRKLKNLLSCHCLSTASEESRLVKSGLFVVTSHRCFIAKDVVENASATKKSPFVLALILGIILILLGLVCIPLFFIGIFLLAAAFLTKSKKDAGFLKEDHNFSAFPRSVLTEYNSFTCKKELLNGLKTGCCGSSVAVSCYKTVLTVGMNFKGEHSSIAPEKNIELVLDPAQVANYQQALQIVSKLTELAQKAN